MSRTDPATSTATTDSDSETDRDDRAAAHRWHP